VGAAGGRIKPARVAIIAMLQETTRMPPPDSRIRVKKFDDVTQVEFIDRNILDEANIQIIGDEIAALVDGSPNPSW
jgi:hypothetical protein